MPDSTSLTRSQGSSADLPTAENSNETLRPSISTPSPILKPKRYGLECFCNMLIPTSCIF